jgi:prepilin-type N-terminal cleavage/methylation domain-containing protein
MLNELWLRNQHGFTLIEMISVMIIIGVVASVAIQKFDELSDTAA